MMKLFRFLPLTLLPAIACNLAVAAEPDPLFASQDLLEITMRGPFNVISRDKDEEPEPRPGTLEFTDETGNPVTLAVELEPRGKSRRDRAVCAPVGTFR